MKGGNKKVAFVMIHGMGETERAYSHPCIRRIFLNG